MHRGYPRQERGQPAQQHAHSSLAKATWPVLTNPSSVLLSGSLIHAQGASELCGTQDKAHLLGLLLFQIVFALSELLTVAREWHCRHHLPKERWSGLVTPRCSQAGNRTSSHCSHTSTHYTVKQKYLYFPGWLWWFLMPLTLNHALFYYLRKTPNSCWAGSATWNSFASVTPRALKGSLVGLWCLGKACHGLCGPPLFVSNECKAKPKSLCRIPLCWWTKMSRGYSHELVLQELDHTSQNYPCSSLPAFSVLTFNLNSDIWL